jgi:FG-GAP-like repeat
MRFSPVAVLLTLLGPLAGCGPNVPEPGSAEFLDASGAFYSGVAAMQIGDDLRARARLELVTELVDTESAAWANLALLALRRGETDAAASAISHVRGEDHPGIALISSAVSLANMDTARAIDLLKLESVAGNPRVLFALSNLLGSVSRSPEADQAMAQAEVLLPSNRAIGHRYALLRARSGSSGPAKAWAASMLDTPLPFPDPATFEGALSAVRDAPDEQVVQMLTRAGNVLMRADWFRKDLDAVLTPPELVAEPIRLPVALAAVNGAADPADRALRLTENRLPIDENGWTWSTSVFLSDNPLSSVLLAKSRQMTTPDGSSIELPFSIEQVSGSVAADLDQDFLMDLVLAGPAGVTILFQAPDGTFAERPDAIPPLGALIGVWAVDFDMEGDLDLVASQPGTGLTVFLNRGDGTFFQHSLISAESADQVVWADLDSDGDPDLAFRTLTARLIVRSNLRNGRWGPEVELATQSAGLAIDDYDRNGSYDLATLVDGHPYRFTLAPAGWVSTPVALAGVPVALDGEASLRLVELDNNGALDWVISTASSAQVLLGEADGSLFALAALDGFHLDGAASLTDAGAPELFGRDTDGAPLTYFAQGEAGYHWKRLRPQTAEVLGDRRINTFAVGGDVELRSGLLYQRMPITGHNLHFGLGDNQFTEVARIIWPNGDVQVEFDLLSDETVLAQQRLKGSCPWVFAYNGQEFEFVTDFLWRSPLGLRINAQETAGIASTSDRIRIPGEALVAVDGSYEIRITAELWESHFFDHVSLMVVDHPDETHALLDERFAFPPPSMEVQLFGQTGPMASVWDASGLPADARAADRDGQYVAGFALGAYQGIAEEHSTEMLLPEAAPENVVLTGFGWVRPTDSSINVAIGQGATPRPSSLQLEVPDQTGGWKTVRADLGFPSGKEKTVLIDLAGLWPNGEPRRLRLRTNLEIYWDQLAWAARSGQKTKTTLLQPESAELKYRGFSEVTAADSESPEIPDYQTFAASHPIWRDLQGYHTRFGDVRELVAAVDDRYVIMNAGDEMIFRFRAPTDPPSGWTRDYVLIGDGWVKDGDLNTTFSTTILPLPTHANRAYDRAPSGLESDPVYLAHKADWETFHTRFVAPDRFHTALSGGGQ